MIALIGDRAYGYDLNGNQTGWDHVQNGTRRTIVWDEENRIQEVSDNGHTKTYKYDDSGERVIKRGPQGETAYINQFFTMRNREVGTKHVFAGGTRLVSKLVKAPNVVDVDGDGLPDDIANACSEPWGWTNGNGGQGNANGICNGNGGQNGNGNGNTTGTPEVFEKDQYYYHPDHLGSSSYVTDLDGEICKRCFGPTLYGKGMTLLPRMKAIAPSVSSSLTASFLASLSDVNWSSQTWLEPS